MGKLIKVLIISTILTMSLSACKTMPPKVEIVEKIVPIMYIPPPPRIERPVLVTPLLADDDTIGAYTKAYADDLTVVLRYTTILEQIIAKYDELSKRNPEVPNSLPIEDATMLDKVKLFFKKVVE